MDNFDIPVLLSLKKSTPSVVSSRHKDIRALLPYLEQQAQNPWNPQNSYAVMLEYEISFKTITKNGLPVRYNKSGIPFRITDEQFSDKFPFGFKEHLHGAKNDNP